MKCRRIFALALAIALLARALARLTERAAEIKEENDLTV